MFSGEKTFRSPYFLEVILDGALYPSGLETPRFPKYRQPAKVKPPSPLIEQACIQEKQVVASLKESLAGRHSYTLIGGEIPEDITAVWSQCAVLSDIGWRTDRNASRTDNLSKDGVENLLNCGAEMLQSRSDLILQSILKKARGEAVVEASKAVSLYKVRVYSAGVVTSVDTTECVGTVGVTADDGSTIIRLQ